MKTLTAQNAKNNSNHPEDNFDSPIVCVFDAAETFGQTDFKTSSLAISIFDDGKCFSQVARNNNNGALYKIAKWLRSNGNFHSMFIHPMKPESRFSDFLDQKT